MSARNKMFSVVLAAGIALVPQAAQAVTTLNITSGGSAVTSIQAGDTLDVSGSGPILTDGATEQSVYANWSKQSLKLKDTTSIVKPEGWTLEYTTDGTTWSATTPTAPNLKNVVGIRSVGDVTSLGASKFQTSTTGEAVASSGTYEAGGGGDGMEVTFADDMVINIFHHDATSVKIACHMRLTGNSCYTSGLADYREIAGYTTGNASMAYWRAGKLYVQAKQTSTDDLGILCVDMSDATKIQTPIACGTPFIKLGTGAANDLGVSAQVGTKIYIPNASQNTMMCFDMATGLACKDWTTFIVLPTGTPAYNSPSTAYGRASAVGGKVYFAVKGFIGCYDPATDALCGSSTGTAITASYVSTYQFPLFPVRNSSGVLQGMCLYSSKQCIDSAGQVVSPNPIPLALSTWMTSHPIPGWVTNNAGYWAEVNNKIYLPVGPSGTATADAYCFDYTTGTVCSGFGTSNNGIATGVGNQIYMFKVDPLLDDCIWTNGNAGQITNFDAFTGKKGCVFGIKKVNMPYTATVPRMSCQESGRVTQWDKAIFHAPAGITTSQLKITILNSSGVAITGWTNRSLDTDGILDMSSLTTADTGLKPTIQADANNTGGRAIYDLTADVKYTAGNPEICFTLLAAENCPSVTNGGLTVADGLVSSTVISTPTSGSAQIDKVTKTLTGTNATASCTPTISEVSLPSSDPNSGGSDPNSPSGITASSGNTATTAAAAKTKKGLAATGAAGTTLGLEFILGYYLLRRGSHLATATSDSEE